MSSLPQNAKSGPASLREDPVPADVSAVWALAAAAGVFSKVEVELAASLVEERLRDGLRAGYHFVFAETGDRLAGYTCFGPIPATQSSFDLYWIAVDPRARGRGLGAHLLAHSERRSAELGARRVYIDTSSRRDYASAHALYTRSGYRLAAALEDFYAPGDAKWIFEKALSVDGVAR